MQRTLLATVGKRWMNYVPHLCELTQCWWAKHIWYIFGLFVHIWFANRTEVKVAQWPASLVARCKTLLQNKKKKWVKFTIGLLMFSNHLLLFFRDGRIKRVHEKLNSSNLCVHLFRDWNRTHSLIHLCCWLCFMNQLQSQEPEARSGSLSHLSPAQQLKQIGNRLSLLFNFY